MTRERQARFLRLLLLLILLLPAIPHTAQGQEDGGTVSVFREGSGGRSQGLGGAYTAIANDALGWTWNPGGLGWITRGEGQIGQQTASELDLTQVQVGLVYPRWRFGTFSFAYRELRVGGIEGRDARNAVTDGDLSDSETELTFGYGKPISQAWTVGVAAKWRRQGIAGRAGNSIGADIGFGLKPARLLQSAPRWTEGLSAGFSIQNVIQPALRLDLDEVRDPRGANLGFAYERRVLGNRAITWSLDLDITQGRSARPRTGVELRVHDQLDIRVGMRDTRLTAGTGIRTGPVSLDYVFEDDELATRHRIGLSTRFGKSTEDERAAAYSAQENEVQRRIAEEFQVRQSERIRELIEEAERLRTERNFDLALERTAAIRVLDPESEPAGRIEAACLRDLAGAAELRGDPAEAAVLYQRALTAFAADSAAAQGLKRARATSDDRSRRTDRVRERFRNGLDAFMTDDLAAARAAFRQVLELDPDDQEAGMMLQRIDATAANRVKGLAAQGERLLGLGLRAEAVQALNQARALNASSPDVARLQVLLQRSRASANDSTVASRRTSRAQPSDNAPTEEQQREAEKLYRRGLEADSHGRSSEAIQYVELARSLNPAHPGAVSYLRRAYQMKGLDAFAGGRLEDAIALWDKALGVDPGDQRTRAYLLRAQEHLIRVQALESR